MVREGRMLLVFHSRLSMTHVNLGSLTSFFVSHTMLPCSDLQFPCAEAGLIPGTPRICLRLVCRAGLNLQIIKVRRCNFITVHQAIAAGSMVQVTSIDSSGMSVARKNQFRRQPPCDSCTA